MRLLRAAAFRLFFYVSTTLVCVIGGIPVLLFARHRALPLAHIWVRVVLAGARILCGIRIEVSGREHLPIEGPALLACQHQSEVDTLLWFTLVPKPSYVMKRELTRIPLFGALLVGSGMIPVDRDAGATALRKLLEATIGMAGAGRQIVIFPEGTRVPPGRRVVLQPGVAAIARQTGLPVIPVSLDTGRLWGRGTFDLRPGVIHVAVHPPLPAATPRGVLLAAVEAAWRGEEAARAHPVDNSVESDPAKLMSAIK